MTTGKQWMKMGAGLLGGAALIVALVLHLREPRVESLSSAKHDSFRSANKAGIVQNVRQQVSPTGEVPPRKLNYKNLLAESSNYWTYAKTLLPSARAGDADAQFYLSKVLERCDSDSRFFLRHRGATLALEQVLQYATQRHLPIELAQSAFDRCHQFNQNDASEFGDAADWLAQATSAGQPVALATTASKILLQGMQQSFAKANGVPNSSAAAPISTQWDPGDLMRRAVASGDPDVLFSIGEAQALLNPSGNNESIERHAWWLVACERGLDCSSNADWIKATCSTNSQCASYDGPSDYVRSLSGDDWPDVQQRAKEINAKLDAGLWNELGIGS